MSTRDYATNGQFVLNKLSVFSKDANGEDEIEWDLIPSYIECSLFESIYDQTMSGYVAVLDSLNVVDLLPLYGNERIEIEFHTAGSDNVIEYKGRIYKVSERTQVTEKTSGHILRFVSDAMILSERIFVQQGIQDTPDNVVRWLYDTYLTPETEPKPLHTQTGMYVIPYTFGTLHPLEAIAIVSRGCAAADYTHGYMFYENNQEFRFETIESMYQKDPVARYYSAHHGMYDDVKNRVAETFERVQKVIFDEENSLLDRMHDGTHGSDHVFFDLVTKQVVNHHYRKEDYYLETASLGDTPHKKTIDPGTDITFLSYVNNTIDSTIDDVISRMAKIQSETFRAYITVFGDSALKAGNVLDVYLPRLNTAPEEMTSVFEGKVLIAALRHTITKDMYMQEIEIVKDSYNVRN